MSSGSSRFVRLILDYSLLLVGGTLAALVWANAAPASYAHLAHALHFAVNDVGMVFFFALATKEVAEATLPGGALSSPRQAALPIIAAVGGMAVPAGLFVLGATLSHHRELVNGWAVPCATDIAFSYLAARMIFPRSSPAIPFLLLLAIADDALGLVVLAVFYPSGPLDPASFAMFMVPALVIAWVLRRRRVTSYWAYLIVPGALSWLALHRGGLHPALALVPIVPFMPSARRDRGLFDEDEDRGHDTLNRFEHAWKVPVQVMLLFFGFANAGVLLAAVGLPTGLVLGGLIVGKPLGIVLMTRVGEWCGLQRAAGLDMRSLVVLGVAAGIGFTVALFFAAAAFAPGLLLDEVKMGALLSFLALPLAVLLARALGLRRAA